MIVKILEPGIERQDEDQVRIKAHSVEVIVGEQVFRLVDDKHSQSGPWDEKKRLLVYADKYKGNIASGRMVIRPIAANVVKLEIER